MLLLAILGATVGTLGTLVGAGGGFILVPILLIIYPDRDPAQVTAMSLLVVFANASSGSVAYARQRRIDYQSGLIFAVSTLPGAILGAVVIDYIPRRLFSLLFAAILVTIAAYVVMASRVERTRDPLEGRGVVTRILRDGEGQTFLYSYNVWTGILISMLVGFIATLLGIGGGVVHVPIMATILHFPVHIAVGTSHFVLALMAGQGVATHFATGTLVFDRSLAEAAALAAGAIPGAQVGARLSHRLKGQTIVRVLAVALLVVALRLGWTGIRG